MRSSRSSWPLLQKEITKRFGADPRSSTDFGRIINSGHTQRIKNLLDQGGFELVCGGEVDVEQKYVAPTVVRAVAGDAAVMGEEIFGPVLPVLTFEDLTEATDRINAGDKPLALYLFTGSDATVEHVIGATSSGGVCVNEAITHLLVSSLPFGGVGDSGYGVLPRAVGLRDLQPPQGRLPPPLVADRRAVAQPALPEVEAEADPPLLLRVARAWGRAAPGPTIPP